MSTGIASYLFCREREEEEKEYEAKYKESEFCPHWSTVAILATTWLFWTPLLILSCSDFRLVVHIGDDFDHPKGHP